MQFNSHASQFDIVSDRLNMSKKSAQIQIDFGLITAGVFLIGSLIFAVNFYLKSNEAIEQVSEVHGDIKVINNRLENIEKILERWQEIQIKDGKLSKDGMVK